MEVLDCLIIYVCILIDTAREEMGTFHIGIQSWLAYYNRPWEVMQELQLFAQWALHEAISSNPGIPFYLQVVRKKWLSVHRSM